MIARIEVSKRLMAAYDGVGVVGGEGERTGDLVVFRVCGWLKRVMARHEILRPMI